MTKQLWYIRFFSNKVYEWAQCENKLRRDYSFCQIGVIYMFSTDRQIDLQKRGKVNFGHLRLQLNVNKIFTR